MKIQTKSGNVIDTKNMGDVESEVTLAINNLYNTCKRYNVSLLTRVIFEGEKSMGADFIREGTDTEKSSDILFMMDILNEHVSTVSNNQIRLVRLKGEDEFE